MKRVHLNSYENSNPFDWHEFSSSTIMGIGSMKSMLMDDLHQELWTAVTNFHKSHPLKYKPNHFLNITRKIQAGGSVACSDQKLDSIWNLLVYLNKEKVWVPHCLSVRSSPGTRASHLSSVPQHGVRRLGQLLPTDDLQNQLLLRTGRKWISRVGVECAWKMARRRLEGKR